MANRLYLGKRAWILVPGCLQAPLQAEATHGPLRLVGDATLGALTFDELSGIQRQFDAKSYALLEEELATRLVSGSPFAVAT